MSESTDEVPVLHPTSGEVLVEAHKMTDDLEKKTERRQEKIIVALSVICIVEILLVFGVIVAVTKDQSTNMQLAQVQQATSSQVLCPVYQVVLDREQKVYALETSPIVKQQEQKLIETIQHGINVLGCSHL